MKRVLILSLFVSFSLKSFSRNCQIHLENYKSYRSKAENLGETGAAIAGIIGNFAYPGLGGLLASGAAVLGCAGLHYLAEREMEEYKKCVRENESKAKKQWKAKKKAEKDAEAQAEAELLGKIG